MTQPAARLAAAPADGLPPPVPFWLAFSRHRLGVAGMGVVLLLLTVALLAPVLAPYDPTQTAATEMLQPPSARHWLGTDNLGRDLLSQLIYGARVSMTVGLGAVAIGGGVGCFVGLVSGYVGGRVDDAVMRLMDALLAFPNLVLAIVISGSLRPGLWTTILAISVGAIPSYARLVRGQVLQVKALDFIEAAHAIGVPLWRLLVRHLLPNVIGIALIQATVSVASAILTEASLSFLGLGVPPPTPTWGGILRRSYGMVEVAPWVPLASGGAIFIAVLAFNLFGDALRDALDPRLRHKTR